MGKKSQYITRQILTFTIVAFSLGCGQKQAFVTLVPGASSSGPLHEKELNLSKLLELGFLPSTLQSTGSCSQPNSLAFVLLNLNTNNTQAVNPVHIPLTTSFKTAGATAPSSGDIASALGDSNSTNFAGPINVSVPSGSNLNVGMIGLTLLGGAGTGGQCAAGTRTTTLPTTFSTFIGTAPIQTGVSATVSLPLNVAPDLGTIFIGSSTATSFTAASIQNFLARENYDYFWFKIPAPTCGTLGIFHFSASVTLNLPGPNLNTLTLPLEDNVQFSTPSAAISYLPVAVGAATTSIQIFGSSSLAYIVPSIGNYTFNLSYSYSGGTGAAPCNGQSLNLSFTCNNSGGNSGWEQHYSDASGKNGPAIRAFGVDVGTQTCISPSNL